MEDPIKPDNNGGMMPEGTDSLEEIQKKLEEKKAQREGLEKALEEEEILIAEHEEKVREAREKRQNLPPLNPPVPPPSNPPKPDVPDIVREVRHQLLSETKESNLKNAKRAFYRLPEGKIYDPLNDSSGRSWNELTDFLHLTDKDLSVEDILRKLKGAAFAHRGQDSTVSDEQRRKNEEEAQRALNDLGSGGRSGGERPGMSAPPADKPTEEDVRAAAKLNVKVDAYMRAKQKVLQRKK